LGRVLGADLDVAARGGHVRAVAGLRRVRRDDPVEADRGRDPDAAAVLVAALGLGLVFAGVGPLRTVAVLRGRERLRVVVGVRVRVVVDLILFLLVGVAVVLVGALRRRVGVRLAVRRRLGADRDRRALDVAVDCRERVPVEDDVERDADADGRAAGG